ncbi:Protein transport protein Sec61 subunit beta [Acorus calamus]|uniref:Protein transport protein Sec61 subunit beta n=1 Tax=Acorus calamus TaxID=4465 RepID=A0AAV9EFT6_ACOCL|nr:Protein transport protein Sec61 subunit beta [Acorus calamus]
MIESDERNPKVVTPFDDDEFSDSIFRWRREALNRRRHRRWRPVRGRWLLGEPRRRSAGMRRRRVGAGGGGGGGGGGSGGFGGGGGSNVLRFYTDDAPGLKMSPTVVLVMSLCFIGFVTALHVFGKLYRYRSAGGA